MNVPLMPAGVTASVNARQTVTAIPPMPDYHARVLGYMAGAAILLTGVMTGEFHPLVIWLVPMALLWPHLLYFACQTWLPQRSARMRQRLMLVDGVLIGSLITTLQFSLVPTFFLLLMINLSCIIVGGIRAWSMNWLALFTGVALTAPFIPIAPWVPAVSLPLFLVSALATGIFTCTMAFYTYLQARALMMAKSQIQYQREQSIALSHKLAKYLSPQVWQSIFTGERDVRLETQRKKLAVFFSDIRGFTELSEEMEPEALTELLNTYFTEMSQIALRFGGTIDKFVGDSIMIFFGDPTSRGAREDTLACVAMAIEMRKHMTVLRQKWRSQGIRTPLEIRTGISTGFCTVGNFGADNRMDYTIIGKEVNLASRLEALAESSEILVSYETFSLIKDKIMCRDKGEITVKGFTRPVPIYEVVDFRRDLGSQSSFMEHEGEGFAMYLDSQKVNPGERDRIIMALDQASRRLREEN
ncbi:MAG: adenylate/guanylate cyclase domain-containing protein [Oleiphilaceae bacterium]|nr:adenylate/guanylate cyclase domain-containing protein [Oleiphilaceae bacterium]